MPAINIPLDMSEESKRALLIRIPEEPVYGLSPKNEITGAMGMDEEAYNSEDYPAHDKAANLPDYVVSKERCQALLKEIERMPENWRQSRRSD